MLATKQEIKPYPTRTNQIPRHIPPPHWASHPAVLFLAAGLLPYGTIFVELYFAMTSIWQVWPWLQNLCPLVREQQSPYSSKPEAWQRLPMSCGVQLWHKLHLAVHALSRSLY